jgi:tetratricopeptide (TPR) repeat protein
MRLCPIYPIWYLYALGTACRLTHENDSAADAFKEAVKRSPDYLAPHVGLASALGELGQSEEAKETVFEILRLEPDFSIKKYTEGLSYRDNAELERFQKGLLKAGLPA